MPLMYAERRRKVFERMRRDGIAALMIEDTEGRRSQSLRWLTGHPSDALLFLIAGADGRPDDPNDRRAEDRAVLVPWDANLAAALADADELLPFSDFERDAVKAAGGVLLNRLPAASTVELPPSLPYPRFADFADALRSLHPVCRDGGIEEAVRELRSVKDAAEIDALKRACAVTNRVIDMIETGFQRGEFATELDVAMLIERESRRVGAEIGDAAGGEGTGFETIVAGPERSFGIHAFPSFGDGKLGGVGFTIIDFGVKVDGYTSDVTVTVAREPLGPERREMLDLVERAYDAAVGLVSPGMETRAAAVAVEALFAAAGRTMPHSLGHGIGLEAHEAPVLRPREAGGKTLVPGMVVTVEPGLYDPVLGGVRLENDLLIGEEGATALTRSRIIRL